MQLLATKGNVVAHRQEVGKTLCFPNPETMDEAELEEYYRYRYNIGCVVFVKNPNEKMEQVIKKLVEENIFRIDNSRYIKNGNFDFALFPVCQKDKDRPSRIWSFRNLFRWSPTG